MTELYHFKNKWGRHMVGVFLEVKPRTPAEHEHEQRYAAGLEPPHYTPLPVQYRFCGCCKDGHPTCLTELLRR